ncbi:hypothetical protein A8C75_21005 [Marinobacterium aestuarii]|uniref:Uncharacterized protein n=1 Tax=Marinobacterium aestuarii TaxID=1821621 RepID=A0A1A9F492_9GAMM|nr:hypothetical protein A8C75_21005 [Marinobacterium aestuarii]
MTSSDNRHRNTACALISRCIVKPIGCKRNIGCIAMTNHACISDKGGCCHTSRARRHGGNKPTIVTAIIIEGWIHDCDNTLVRNSRCSRIRT